MSQPSLPLEAAPPPSRTRRGTRRAGAPYVAGSDNSRAAAKRIVASGRLGRAQTIVLRLLAGYARTDNDLILAWTYGNYGSPNTPRARRVELAEAGLIEAVGVEGGSTIWGLTPAGRKALENNP